MKRAALRRPKGSGLEAPRGVQAKRGGSGAREGVSSAGCKSVSEDAVGSVAEGHCVAARWGGRQPEANDRSAGSEPVAAGCRGEPSGRRRSLKLTVDAGEGVRSDPWAASPGWGWNDRTVRRSQRRDLPAEVSVGRSQSPQSRAGSRLDSQGLTGRRHPSKALGCRPCRGLIWCGREARRAKPR